MEVTDIWKRDSQKRREENALGRDERIKATHDTMTLSHLPCSSNYYSVIPFFSPDKNAIPIQKIKNKKKLDCAIFRSLPFIYT